MEIHWVEAAGTERIGPTFRFTGDLMTRVFLSGKHDDDQDEVEYYRSLITLMSDGFTHATTCVALITDQYLGPLFGFGAS
jgi:hypothetical protein